MAYSISWVEKEPIRQKWCKGKSNGQAQRHETGLCGIIGSVLDADDSHFGGDLDQHVPVVDVGDLLRLEHGDIKSELVNVGIGLAQVNETGNDEKIDKRFQMESLDTIEGKFAAFVAYHGDF